MSARSLLSSSKYYLSRLIARSASVECRYLATNMSASRDMDLVVDHDRKRREFFIKLDASEGAAAGERAVLLYDEPRPGVLDLHHTGVPVALRGRGVAKLLAKEAFDFAVLQDHKMILTCTYLQKYYHDNPLPQYKERVVDS